MSFTENNFDIIINDYIEEGIFQSIKYNHLKCLIEKKQGVNYKYIPQNFDMMSESFVKARHFLKIGKECSQESVIFLIKTGIYRGKNLTEYKIGNLGTRELVY